MAAANGEFLWRYDKLGKNTANIPTPIPFGDYVFTAAGYGKGGACSSFCGHPVECLPRRSISRELKNKHGGIVKVGNYLYGDFDDRGSPWSLASEPVKSNGGGMEVDKTRSACVTMRTGVFTFVIKMESWLLSMHPAGWVPSGRFLQNSRWHEEKLGSSGNQRRFALPAWTQQNSLLRRSRSHSGRGSRSVNRVWTDSTGRFKVEARLKGEPRKSHFGKSDGSVFEISLDRLSLSDQAYLRSL